MQANKHPVYVNILISENHSVCWKLCIHPVRSSNTWISSVDFLACWSVCFIMKKIQNWHHAAYHWYISVDNDNICVNGMNAWLVIAYKTACGFCHFSCNKHEVDWGQAEDAGGILQPRLQDLLLPGRRCYDFCTYPKVWGGGGKYGLAVCWRKGLCDNVVCRPKNLSANNKVD